MRTYLQSFILAMFLFSPISIRIFTFGENYYMEIPLFLLFVYFSIKGGWLKDVLIFAYGKYSHKIILTIIYVMVMMFVGMIYHKNAISAYADARSNLLVLCGFLIGFVAISENRTRELTILAYFVSACICIDWAYGYLTGTLDVKYPSPIFAPLSIILIQSKKSSLLKNSLASFTVVAFLAAISFNRQYWLYPLIALCIIFFVSEQKISPLKIIVLGLFSVASTILVLPIVFEYFRSDESRYIQSLGKMEDLSLYFSGVTMLAESDALRAGYIEYIFVRFWELIIPHGLGSREFFGNVSPWFNQFLVDANTIDVGALFLAFHYGLIFLLLLAFHWIKVGFIYLKNKRNIFGLLGMNSAILIPMLLDGGTLTVPQRGLWYGIYIGIVISICLQKKKTNYQ